jgi:hypothetical protein
VRSVIGVRRQAQTIHVLNTAPLIGGAIFYVGIVTATGILQTVSVVNLPWERNRPLTFDLFSVRPRVLPSQVDGHSGQLCVLEDDLGFRYSILCHGEFILSFLI